MCTLLAIFFCSNCKLQHERPEKSYLNEGVQTFLATAQVAQRREKTCENHAYSFQSAVLIHQHVLTSYDLHIQQPAQQAFNARDWEGIVEENVWEERERGRHSPFLLPSFPSLLPMPAMQATYTVDSDTYTEWH